MPDFYGMTKKVKCDGQEGQGLILILKTLTLKDTHSTIKSAITQSCSNEFHAAESTLHSGCCVWTGSMEANFTQTKPDALSCLYSVLLY